MVFEPKCVLAVCVHNHPIMIKIHLILFFFISTNHKHFLRTSCSQILGKVTSHDCWRTLAFYHRHRCNNEHSSRHLLSTCEPLKTQWITFVFEGNVPPDQPKYVYVLVNHSWSSFTYRRSEYEFYLFFYESFKIAFPNNVLASNFRDERRWKRRGGVSSSSLSFKGTCTETGCCEQSCFWQGKKGVVLHCHWGILTKVCYRRFTKTI